MPLESANFIVENVENRHDTQDMKQKLNSLHGISSVSLIYVHNLVSIDYDSAGTSYDEIENCLNDMGFEIAADASVIHTR